MERKIELPQCECSHCGHKWSPKVILPQSCPKCKSYHWDEEKVTIKDAAEPYGVFEE